MISRLPRLSLGTGLSTYPSPKCFSIPGPAMRHCIGPGLVNNYETNTGWFLAVFEAVGMPCNLVLKQHGLVWKFDSWRHWELDTDRSDLRKDISKASIGSKEFNTSSYEVFFKNDQINYWNKQLIWIWHCWTVFENSSYVK